MYNPLQPQFQPDPNFNFFSLNGIQKLQGLPGVFLKEQLQMLEVVCGIHMPCNFQVLPADHLGNQAGETPIFMSQEKSECLQRVCLPANCRAYDIHMDSYNSGPFMRLSRNYKCTCLCFNRPEVECHIVEGGQNVYAGKVVNPFFWCNMGVNVHDRSGNIKYIVEGSCCQTGVLCQGFPCEACQTVYFDVKSPTGEVLSTLVKRSQGCLRACCTNCDNFSVVFPPNATVEDKALLTATALLINYQYFEQTPQEKNQANNQRF